MRGKESMAKKKMAEPIKAKPKPNILVIRGSQEWRDWLIRAAEEDRAQSVAELVDRALELYARKKNLEHPPRR